MQAVLIHPLSGLLSAYGIGLSKTFASRQHALVKPLEDATKPEIGSLLNRLGAAVEEELESQGVEADAIATRATLHIRYDGTDTTLEVPYEGEDIAAARAAFEAAHRAQFGFISPGRAMVVEAVGLAGEDCADNAPAPAPHDAPDHRPEPAHAGRMFTGGDGTRRGCGSSKTWNARSSPRTARFRQRGWAAAATARWTRPRSGAWTARSTSSNMSTRPR